MVQESESSGPRATSHRDHLGARPLLFFSFLAGGLHPLSLSFHVYKWGYHSCITGLSLDVVSKLNTKSSAHRELVHAQYPCLAYTLPRAPVSSCLESGMKQRMSSLLHPRWQDVLRP